LSTVRCLLNINIPTIAHGSCSFSVQIAMIQIGGSNLKLKNNVAGYKGLVHRPSSSPDAVLLISRPIIVLSLCHRGNGFVMGLKMFPFRKIMYNKWTCFRPSSLCLYGSAVSIEFCPYEF
jgi:hypothetical protein